MQATSFAQIPSVLATAHSLHKAVLIVLLTELKCLTDVLLNKLKFTSIFYLVYKIVVLNADTNMQKDN